MTDKEAMKMALEALEYWDVHGKLHQPTEEAIAALKARLAQPEQEPVAWLVEFENGEQELHFDEQSVGEIHTPLYSIPPQRTEPAQQKKVWTFWDLSGGDITDAIKAKLKEKNQ
jgi:hypothetical protein